MPVESTASFPYSTTCTDRLSKGRGCRHTSAFVSTYPAAPRPNTRISRPREPLRHSPRESDFQDACKTGNTDTFSTSYMPSRDNPSDTADISMQTLFYLWTAVMSSGNELHDIPARIRIERDEQLYPKHAGLFQNFRLTARSQDSSDHRCHTGQPLRSNSSASLSFPHHRYSARVQVGCR